MLRDHGTMTLEEVLTPAIGYARDGYPLIAGVTGAIAGVADLFRTEWPTSAAVYLPDGKVPATGSLFRNVKLADTYARILKEARRRAATAIKQIEARTRGLLPRASSPRRSRPTAARPR